MLFSILIAHYNNYHYFTECYQSILKQTYQNFEVIIVDDGSTDDSVEQIKKLTQNDYRVKIFINEENRGVGYTKRKCVEMATGEICGFVDPDDALAESAVQQSINEYQDDGIVATHSDIMMCDSNLQPVKPFPNIKSVAPGNKFFFNVNFTLNHFFTFRKAAYEKTEGINPELTSAVDQDLYLKIYETGKIKYINASLYLYRLHDKGVSQEKTKKDKLNKNWDKVLRDTAKRRNITKLNGKPIDEIPSLQHFIKAKQSSFLSKILNRFR